MREPAEEITVLVPKTCGYFLKLRAVMLLQRYCNSANGRQTQVAHELGIHTTSLNRYIRLRTLPSEDVAFKIIDFITKKQLMFEDLPTIRVKA